MSTLGDYLKSKREAQDITIEAIHVRTSIRKEHLEMLEQGAFEGLPSYVHAYGFLNQYCKVVELDFENEIKPMFDAECSKENFGKTKEEINLEKQTKERATKSATLRSVLLVLLFLMVLAIGAITVMHVLQKNMDGETEQAIYPYQYQPQQPAATPVSPVTAEAETEAPAITDEPAYEQQNTILTESVIDADTTQRRAVLTFTDTCWVNLVPDIGGSEDFIAENGHQKVVNFDRYFRIDVGNASAVSVLYNGRTYSGLGGWRQPLRDLYFSVDENNALIRSRTRPN